MLELQKVDYTKLNARAKEMYNFHKVAAALADYGYTSMWLNNDWQGADFIAVHIDGTTDLKVQLKGRIAFDRKYIGKDIYICFIEDGDIYLYPHDHILSIVEHRISDQKWIKTGSWSTPRLTKQNKELLKDYSL